MQTESRVGVYIGPGRSVRSGLNAGASYTITGKFTDEDGILWWRLEWPNAPDVEKDRYWIKDEHVTTNGDCEAVADATPPGMIAAPPPSRPTVSTSVTPSSGGSSDATPAQPGDLGAVDCTGFQVLGPLEGLSYGRTTIYWQRPPDAAGITDYWVVIEDENGRSVLLQNVGADRDHVDVDLDFDKYEPGYTITLYVRLKIVGEAGNDRVFGNAPVCSTPWVRMPRAMS